MSSRSSGPRPQDLVWLRRVRDRIDREYARPLNLEDVRVERPERRRTVFTGVTGSGPSSLAPSPAPTSTGSKV